MLFMLHLILRIKKNVIKETRTNLSKYLLKTLFIRHINVASAFVRPNGTATNSMLAQSTVVNQTLLF